MSEAILAFQSQLSGVMETVFKAAMYEIIRLVEDSFLEEVSRSREQVETLKKRLQLSESKRKEREGDGRSRCAECGRAGAASDQMEDRLAGAAHGVTEGHGLKQEGAQESKWDGCPREDVDPAVRVLDETMPGPTMSSEAINLESTKLDSLKKEAFQLTSQSPEVPERWPVSLEADDVYPAHLDGGFNEQQAQCSDEEWASSSRQGIQQALKGNRRFGPGFNAEELSRLEDALGVEPKAQCLTQVFSVSELGSQGLEDPLSVRVNFGAPGHMQTELEVADEADEAPVLPGSLRSRRAPLGDQHGIVSGSPHDDVDVGELNYLLINEDGYLQDTDDRYWGQREVEPGSGEGQLEKKLHDEMTSVDKNAEYHSDSLQVHTVSRRERPRSCSQCHTSFPDSASLKAHMNTHKTGSAYTCTQCGKSFTQACNLKVHQRIHSREGLHLCSHCGKGFVSFSDLKKHKCSHASDKPYCCMLCGNKFSRLWNLKLHRRIHTQEKPHQCTQCEKSFTRADILKVHQRTHTGERPYCCTLCGLSFKRLDHLKSHQRKHKPQQT